MVLFQHKCRYCRNSEERLKAADVVLVSRLFANKTPFFSYHLIVGQGYCLGRREKCCAVSRLGFFPSSAEAWPLKCLCILVSTLLRATALNKKSCQLLPELGIDDSSGVVRLSIPCALSRGSL